MSKGLHKEMKSYMKGILSVFPKIVLFLVNGLFCAQFYLEMTDPESSGLAQRILVNFCSLIKGKKYLQVILLVF